MIEPGFSVCGDYAGGGRRESRFDTNPRYMVAARKVKRSNSMNLRKIGDWEQPISKQSAKTREYNSIFRE